MQNYQILLPKNFDEPFDYFSDIALEVGDFVSVPFRTAQEIGVVWGKAEPEIDPAKIKNVIAKLPIPPLTHKFIKFLEWVAEYNMAPLGNILKMALSVKFTKKELLPPPTPPIRRGATAESPPYKGGLRGVQTLEGFQTQAAQNLISKVTNKFSASVLDGVTGSGKTEVYFEAIDEALSKGKQVLVMLPEIGLSHQWLLRFQQRFGVEPGIWHSDRTPKQRREVWLGVAENKCKLVVGARSALFLPFQNLGLIIVDEEHDGSYKQEEGTIYHGRDMAVVRASMEHIPVVLVSATPSIETVQNIREGKYELIHLPERFGGAVLPKIEIVNMKQEKLRADHFISNKLKNLLAENITQKQQSILFLNRRGYAPLTLCRACGHRIQCPSCSAWLVTHKKVDRLTVKQLSSTSCSTAQPLNRSTLLCHHCGFSTMMPQKCPSCAAEGTLHACGPGVERLYEEVLEYFPDAKVEVMASDSPKAAEEIVQRMINHDIDILIGTQMIAKGHHFPKLQLVGIVDADLGLEGGDLRAMERSYQILHQVAGRAGREQEEGKVIIQTYNPQNLVMQALISGERDEFVDNELLARRRFEMPPFGRLATIMVSGKNEREVKKYITDLSLNAPKSREVHLLGPAPAPMSFLRGQYRYRLILRSGKKFQMQKFIKAVLAATPTPRQLKVKIDIDPFSFV